MEGVYFTNEVTIAVPNKGRVKEPSFRLLEDIGIKADMNDERRLIMPTSQPGVRILLARSMDIPLYVVRGAADLGIGGEDALAERGVISGSPPWPGGPSVVKLLPLDFGGCKVALAAPGGVKTPGSIATALPGITRAYCRKKGINPDIVVMQGALEAAPKLGMAEAIVDQVATGTTLRENGLRVLDVIMETRMYLIGNPVSVKGKAEAIDQIVLLAQGVLEARKRVFLRVNAATDAIRDALVKLLPAMKSPDVGLLASGGYTVAAAVPKRGLEDLVMELKSAGGSGILVEALKLIIS